MWYADGMDLKQLALAIQTTASSWSGPPGGPLGPGVSAIGTWLSCLAEVLHEELADIRLELSKLRRELEEGRK